MRVIHGDVYLCFSSCAFLNCSSRESCAGCQRLEGTSKDVARPKGNEFLWDTRTSLHNYVCSRCFYSKRLTVYSTDKYLAIFVFLGIKPTIFVFQGTFMTICLLKGKLCWLNDIIVCGTDLISINEVVMFNRIDFSNCIGHSKSHNSHWESVHRRHLENLQVGSQWGLEP